VRSGVVLAFGVVAFAAAPRAAFAQSPAVERFGLETTVSVDQFAGDGAVNRPNIVIDVTASVRLGSEWQIYVRPWLRQPRTPSWDKQIYQAAVRYEHQSRVATRVDAGLIDSPVGLGMADSSPSTNPTIAPHLSYFTPMLPFDTGGPRVSAIASTYPAGARVTLSTNLWDLRGAVVSSAPTRIDLIGGTATPHATPVLEGGAGITPAIGLRLGLSFAHGAYLTSSELARPTAGDRQMTMIGVEGEYAVAYTKISGELLRDTFETTGDPAIAYEWFVQGMQTLSPRWFIAGRHEGTSAPVRGNGAFYRLQPTLKIVEATAGFRVTPEVTLRGSFFTREFYGRTTWDRQAGVQAVWTRRWR
jgi:hypothetical protein